MSDKVTTDLGSIGVDKIGAGKGKEDVGNPGQVLTSGGLDGTISWEDVNTLSGDVDGPNSSTENAVATYDDTTGKLIKQSPVQIDDSGNVTNVNSLNGISSAEIDALDNVSGNIQDQLDNKGDLTETGSSILTISGGDSAVFGTGTTIEVAQADSSTNGFLSSTDWTTFNNKTDSSSTTTFTNKTIDADSNTISNLEHGAEVDDPTSGVHGVTGSIVGTSDSQTLTNKTYSNPTLDGDISGTGVLDEDDLSSNSDVKIATQQSIKAYVDAQTAGASGDTSWQMTDTGNNQIRFDAGSRIVNGIVESFDTDITINSSAVAITNDTLTTLDSANGMLYTASGSVRVFVFYDVVNDEFKGIGNDTETSNYTWDYRNSSSDFDVNLAQNVPIGFVDVTASADPGTLTFSITNFPVQAWTTFNNAAAAEAWTSYNATISAGGTNASVDLSRYQRIGNTVFVEVVLKWTGTGSTSNIIFDLPFDRLRNSTSNDREAIGFCTYSSDGSSGNLTDGAIYSNSVDDCTIIKDGGNLLPANTFSNGGVLAAKIYYEIDAADGYNPIAVGFPDVSDLVQTKTLSSNFTTPGDNEITDLNVTGLTPGKTYRITYKYIYDSNISGQDFFSIDIFDGTIASGSQIINDIGSTEGTSDFFSNSGTLVHKMVNNELSVRAESLASGNRIFGDGTTRETFIQVEEIPQAGTGVLIEPTRYVTKTLSSDDTTDGVHQINDLTVTNLTPGKTYKIRLFAVLDGETSGLDPVPFSVYDGTIASGTTFLQPIAQVQANGEVQSTYAEVIRTLENDRIEVESGNIDVSNLIRGNGTTTETFIQVEEISAREVDSF